MFYIPYPYAKYPNKLYANYRSQTLWILNRNEKFNVFLARNGLEYVLLTADSKTPVLEEIQDQWKHYTSYARNANLITRNRPNSPSSRASKRCIQG